MLVIRSVHHDHMGTTLQPVQAFSVHALFMSAPTLAITVPKKDLGGENRKQRIEKTSGHLQIEFAVSDATGSRERNCSSLPRERWKMKSAFADLFENFFGVLAQPRCRALRGHRGAVEHDRGADAGGGAACGGGGFV